jgi:hypothetical protein
MVHSLLQAVGIAEIQPQKVKRRAHPPGLATELGRLGADCKRHIHPAGSSVPTPRMKHLGLLSRKHF